MSKIKLFLTIVMFLAFVGIAKAENSATGYDATFRSQQVFVSAYAYAAASKNDIVILDVSNSTNGTTKGAYVTPTTSTNSVYTFGVADEDIATGTLGRICVRGPHLVTMYTTGLTIAGERIATSSTSGAGVSYSKPDGTAGGWVGVGLSDTYDTSDTDAAWAWVSPQVHK